MTHAILRMLKSTSITQMCREHSMQMSVELENGKFAGESHSICCDEYLYIVLIFHSKLNKVVIRETLACLNFIIY